MAERLDLYKCKICGQTIQVILRGDGELVCCGQPMAYLQPKTSEPEIGEKHVPVFYVTGDNKCEVRVGEEPHPMVDEHYIQFIEVISNDKNCMKLHYLSPGQEPKIYLQDKCNDDKSLEMCNIHGLWASVGSCCDCDTQN